MSWAAGQVRIEKEDAFSEDHHQVLLVVSTTGLLALKIAFCVCMQGHTGLSSGRVETLEVLTSVRLGAEVEGG